MQSRDISELTEYVVQACLDVFKEASIDLEPGPARGAEVPPGQLGTFIGFMGPRLKGTLTVFAPVSLIQASCPIPLGTSTDLHLFDWSNELSNQIFGRFKNMLVSRGVEIEQSLPKTMLSRGVVLGSQLDAAICALGFSDGRDQLSVFVDAVLGVGAAERLFDEPTAAQACMAEGDLLMF